MNKTKIEWCDMTINPVVGCTFGCEYCYAKKMNDRFQWISDFSKPQFFPERLKKLKSKKSKNIFMNSMSDIADWLLSWEEIIYEAIEQNPQHNYLFLTKRPSTLCLPPISENIWIGTTITSGEDSYRLCELADYAHFNSKFLSIEPLHEDMELRAYHNHFYRIEWVIIGAETGNRKGKIVPKKEWIEHIVIDCEKYGIPVFMKDSLIPIIGEENMLREFPKELAKENE